MKQGINYLNIICVIIGTFIVVPALIQGTNIIEKGKRSETYICPYLSGWEGRSQKLCYKDVDLYHCLLTRDDHYLEVCTQPIKVPPGHFPRISEQLDQLYTEPCPDDTYQPEGAMSNKFKKVTCDYKKNKCDELGESYCSRGSTTSDVQCKCDYMKGYSASEYLLENPKNQTCYNKTHGARCYMGVCKNGTELNPAYKCVNKCDPGYYRPPNQFDCISNQTTRKPSIIITDPITPATALPGTSQAPNPGASTKPRVPSSDKTSRVNVYAVAWFIGISIGVILIGLGVYFIMEKKFKIHMNHPPILHLSCNQRMLLKASLSGFSCFEIQFQWYKKVDGDEEETDLANDSHYQIESEGRSSSLTIEHVEGEDEGHYICSANLKRWRRIAHRAETTLNVIGGEFNTPNPPRKVEENKNMNNSAPLNKELPDKPASIHPGTTIIYVGKAETVTYGNTTIVHTYNEAHRKDSDSSVTSEEKPLLPKSSPKQKPNRGSLDDELRKLEVLLRRSDHNDLRVEDVPGYGDCLYHSFIRNKNIHGLPDSPKEIRRQLVKYLESNPDTPDGTSYKDFLCLPLDPDHGVLQPEDMAIETTVANADDQKELRWQRFLKNIQEGEWGGSLEIRALSQLYNVPVTVLTINPDESRLNEIHFNHTARTTMNPVIYIGHLSVNGIGTHFVALKPFEEKNFEQPASFQQGEPHRKMFDSTYPYKEGEIMFSQNLKNRIGCIETTSGRRTYGTGFRVGTKYVMTAFHVMEDALSRFWKEVYKRLTNEERDLVRWTRDCLPEDGVWRLSTLLSSLELEKMNKLIHIGTESITDEFQIKFGFTSDNPDSINTKFSYEVAFASPSHDIVILELIQGNNLPDPFHLKFTNVPSAKLHVLGHPNGGELQHDPGCRIIEEEEEIDNLVEQGILFFTNQGYTENKVREDYAPCILSPDHILFHCSKSTAHGASGSPLIVIKDKPQVIGMLLRGHPKLYYNYRQNHNKETNDRPDLLVESGISMEKVQSLLIHHSLHELANDLFPR